MDSRNLVYIDLLALADTLYQATLIHFSPAQDYLYASMLGPSIAVPTSRDVSFSLILGRIYSSKYLSHSFDNETIVQI